MKKDSKLLFNTVSSFSVQLAAILASFIVPKCILSAFGSVTNGTVASITQFLGFITLMEAGVGNVSRAALFRPVAERDSRSVSWVVNETHDFFARIALIYAGFVVVFAVVFPLTIDNSESYRYNLILVLVIALANFFQYYFGAGYLQVLWADQKVYILNFTQALAYTLSILTAVLCVRYGAGIHLLKLLSSLVFMIRPIFVNIYVRRKYQIDAKARAPHPVLKQKWNNLLQTIAFFIHSKTDMVILTYFSTFAAVSVYSVYSVITTGISSVIISLCQGFTAKVGNLYGAGEREKLTRTFEVYEHFAYNLTFAAFTTAAILILDFVRIYTIGYNDAQYNQPVFAVVLILAEATYCIRLPYSNMVSVAGHFKQTQMSALLEAAINIILSLILVGRFGLIGIAAGTFAGMLYRTAYLVHYLSRQILERNWEKAVRKLLTFLIVPAVCMPVSQILLRAYHPQGYLDWAMEAAAVLAVVLSVLLTLDLLLYRDLTIRCIQSFKGKARKEASNK